MKPSIYCIYNSCYDYYGKNVYKLGCTIDIDKRICGFCNAGIFSSLDENIRL